MYATGKYIKMPRLDLKKTVKILESIVLKTTSWLYNFYSFILLFSYFLFFPLCHT